jgi:hypothetical protein
MIVIFGEIMQKVVKIKYTNIQVNKGRGRKEKEGLKLVE